MVQRLQAAAVEIGTDHDDETLTQEEKGTYHECRGAVAVAVANVELVERRSVRVQSSRQLGEFNGRYIRRRLRCAGHNGPSAVDMCGWRCGSQFAR